MEKKRRESIGGDWESGRGGDLRPAADGRKEKKDGGKCVTCLLLWPKKKEGEGIGRKDTEARPAFFRRLFARETTGDKHQQLLRKTRSKNSVLIIPREDICQIRTNCTTRVVRTWRRRGIQVGIEKWPISSLDQNGGEGG